MFGLRISWNWDDLLIEQSNGYWMVVSHTGLLMFDASTVARKPSLDVVPGFVPPAT